MLTHGSLFSGIGGIDLGFERAGITTLWQAEVDPRRREVLKRHFPNVLLLDDVKKVNAESVPPVDIISGGFPCQDVSVAGKRAGLAGARTGLFWEFARVVDELQPRYVVAENVPGLLSSNAGRDMGTVLAAFHDLGYGVAYRVLDAQYFGVAQRRRRVIIVAVRDHDTAEAARILFEPHLDPSPNGFQTWTEVACSHLNAGEKLPELKALLESTFGAKYKAGEVDVAHVGAEGFLLPERGKWKNCGLLAGTAGPYGLTFRHVEHAHEIRTQKLEDILEDNVGPEYDLSPRACLGILRRATRRGRTLPPELEAALRKQAGLGPNDAIPDAA